MPLYDFKDKNTGETAQHWIKMSDLDQFKIDNPHLEQLINKVSMTDPIRSGVTKRHPGLTDKLKAIKQANKGSTVDV